MYISKRDDQSLATIGRIANFDSSLAKKFAHSVEFTDKKLQAAVEAFWTSIPEEGHADKEKFSQQIREAKGKDKYTKIILHWLKIFTN